MKHPASENLYGLTRLHCWSAFRTMILQQTAVVSEKASPRACGAKESAQVAYLPPLLTHSFFDPAVFGLYSYFLYSKKMVLQLSSTSKKLSLLFTARGIYL